MLYDNLIVFICMVLQRVKIYLVSAPQLIYGTKVDYIVFDYLSEITMSLLTAAKHKNPVTAFSVLR